MVFNELYKNKKKFLKNGKRNNFSYHILIEIFL